MPGQIASTGSKLHVGPLLSTNATAPAFPGVDWSEIINVDTAGGPDISKAEIDVTPLASLAKEYIDDVADNGTYTFTLFWSPSDTTHRQMLSDAKTSGTKRWWIGEDSDGSTYTFPGIVTSFSKSNAKGSAVTADISIRISGAITENYAP